MANNVKSQKQGLQKCQASSMSWQRIIQRTVLLSMGKANVGQSCRFTLSAAHVPDCLMQY